MADSLRESLAEKRPLSPHLSIWKPTLTMAMSIAHRISGAALYVGFILLAFFLLGLGFGPGAFAKVAWLANSLIGRAFVFLFSWALLHHLLGGVRHAVWDNLYGLDAEGRELLTQATLAGGAALSILLWIASALFG